MRKKVAILINAVSPYRIPLFLGLADSFDLVIADGKREPIHEEWEAPDGDLKTKGVEIYHARGLMIKVGEGKSVHINPDYLTFLFKQKPDAVIAIEMGFRTLCAAFYTVLKRKRLWIWSEGSPHSERSIGPFRKLIRGLLVRVPARFISFGNESTEYLLSIGVRREAILQLQNGVDDRLFQEEGEQEPVNCPRPLLLVVGRLVKLKGIDALLESAQRIQAKGISFSLRFVGSGPRQALLEERARELKLKNVEFVGAFPPERLPAHYRSADVLIFPTLQDVWGLVANEAILCGTPVVCSKYAGCASDIIPPEDVFDPTIPEEFDRALLRAATGEVQIPDRSKIWTMSEIIDALANDLELVLNSPTAEPIPSNQPS